LSSATMKYTCTISHMSRRTRSMSNNRSSTSTQNRIRISSSHASCASRWAMHRPLAPAARPRFPNKSKPEFVLKYERILLKLSGEVMAGAATFGIDADRVRQLATEVAEVVRAGVQLGIVVGGGNIFRGVAAAARTMDRVTADQI